MSMSDIKALIDKAVEDRVSEEVQKIGNLLATDMQNMVRNVTDEIERLGNRVKNIEELINGWNPMTTIEKSRQPTGLRVEDVNIDNSVQHAEDGIKKKGESRNKKKDEPQEDSQEQENCKGNNLHENDGWTLVKKKKAHKRKSHFATGAVLIGGENVRRVSMAANEEFVFDKNVIFASAKEVDSADVRNHLPSAINKTSAEQVDVVIHYGEEAITRSTVDGVLEGFAHVISTAKKQCATRDVFVCSLLERRDVEHEVADAARLVNEQLGELCAAYGARYLDLRDRLKECAHGGINRTGYLYTREGARNVSQLIMSEVTGFLD